MKIYPIRLGLTLGIIWGVSMILLAFISNKNFGSLFFNSISQIYIGCSKKNIFSKLFCGFLGFLDAFIGGILIALLYNSIPITK
jgi:hypothetical protein